MKAIDLFCGLGGWSDGLALEGFEVLGVEIEPKIAELYKHPIIVSDVCDLDPNDFSGYDLIVGSPPCRDFSAMVPLGKKWWKIPPDPKGEGMRLINAFLNFVEIAQPTYWLMENVPGAIKYIKAIHGIEPRNITRLGKHMRRCFWGNFPSFLIFRDFNKPILARVGYRKKYHGVEDLAGYKSDLPSSYRKWIRAIIPLPIARELGKVVKSSILRNVTSNQTMIAEITNESDQK